MKVARKRKARPKEKRPTSLERNPAVQPAHQQRSQEKRDRLIKAGIKTFAENGYEQTRVADLAEAAGISVGVFYQRFKDKRGFFDVLQHEFVQRGRRNWDRYFELEERKCSSSREIFEDIIRALARLIARNIGFMRALFAIGSQDKPQAETPEGLDRYGAEKFEAFLIKRKLVSRSKLRPDQVYIGLSTVTRALVVMHLNAPKDRPPSDTIISELAEMLAAYLGVRLK